MTAFRRSRGAPYAAIALPLVVCVLAAPNAHAQLETRLSKETTAAFEQYVTAAEQIIQQRWQQQRSFLWLRERGDLLARVAQGEVVVERVPPATKEKIPDGMVHHWIAAVLAPGASMAGALTLLQDFDRHHRVYPEIIASRSLNHQGDNFKGYWRLKKEKVLTVVLDTEQSAEYHQVDAKRWYNRAIFTRIREVDDPGTSNERLKPEDEGYGFLWRLNAYWRLEEAPEGVYLECESITLTRDVPFMLRAVVNPFVQALPRESLIGSLEATRQALRH